MVITQENLNTFQRGPGYWKFNSALFSEPEFVTEMSDFITSHFENYKNENPLTAWEMFKVYAKHRCQDYSKKRSKRNVTHKEQLLQQLQATENQLCVEPWNKDLHRKHLQIKKELRWDAMFLPLTKPTWSSLTIELMPFCSLTAIAFVSIL